MKVFRSVAAFAVAFGCAIQSYAGPVKVMKEVAHGPTIRCNTYQDLFDYAGLTQVNIKNVYAFLADNGYLSIASDFTFERCLEKKGEGREFGMVGYSPWQGARMVVETFSNAGLSSKLYQSVLTGAVGYKFNGFIYGPVEEFLTKSQVKDLKAGKSVDLIVKIGVSSPIYGPGSDQNPDTADNYPMSASHTSVKLRLNP